jgi:hypothetical protein
MWIKAPRSTTSRYSTFRDSAKGESHIEERGERLEALARSLRRRHKIKNKEEIGSTRDEARWSSRGGGTTLVVSV